MHKTIIIRVLLSALVLGSFGPETLAQSAQTGDDKPPLSNRVFDSVVGGPKAVAGVLAGLSLGVPVKITKDIGAETKRMAGVVRNDLGNEFGFMDTAVVMAAALPYGVVSGLILGTIKGTKRAFTYGLEKPFSAKSLSLDGPEENY